MKRQIIRITESDLSNIIMESVRTLMENSFDERHVLKLHNDTPMNDPNASAPLPPPPMNDPNDGMPPMDDPNGGMPPMDDAELDDMEDEEMEDDLSDGIDNDEDNGNNSNTQEIDAIFSNLGIEDQSAVLKYAKSMSDDSNNNQNMPMESLRSHNLSRIIREVLDFETRGKDRTTKRNSRDVTNDKIDTTINPFISKR